jgi:hypothetical protein
MQRSIKGTMDIWVISRTITAIPEASVSGKQRGEDSSESFCAMEESSSEAERQVGVGTTTASSSVMAVLPPERRRRRWQESPKWRFI